MPQEKTSHMSTVAIIGLGYVGLPLAILFVDRGYQVIGIDVDPVKIEFLSQNKSYLADLSDQEITKLMSSGAFHPTDRFERIAEVDACILCVPTPLRDHRYPDLSYLQSATSSISHYLKKGQLVILESSTYPGTTEEVLLPLLEQKVGEVGQDFYLGYSPERIDPGNQEYQLDEIPKVVSGVTEACREQVNLLYGQVFKHLVQVSSPRAAELTKLLENCQRFVNISFINEMVKICHEMNINIWEIIDAADTKPYGFTAYYPGPGVGGHCIPVDPLYLTWKAKQFHLDTKFIQLAKEINDEMPSYIVKRIDRLFSSKKQPYGRKILLIGITYKKDVNDIRESTSMTIMEELLKRDYLVTYYDPLVNEIVIDQEKYSSVELTPEIVKSNDCVVILTDHTGLPLNRILQYAPLVFDTRNLLKETYQNVIRL